MNILESTVTNTNNYVVQLTSQQFNETVLHKDYNIIDVRNKAEYDKGAIKGAINIYHEDLEAAFDNLPERFNNELPTVFYCTGGVMSYIAAIKAQKNGFINVFNLEGGYADWIKQSAN
jgi:rhodanese-related sulfurtransferase